MNDNKITKYAVYVNGKLRGYVEGNGTSIDFPAEVTDEVGDGQLLTTEVASMDIN